MNKHKSKYSSLQLVLSVGISLGSTQVLANPINIANYSSAGGDYYLVDNNGDAISDGMVDNAGDGGVDVGGFATPNSVTGSGGASFVVDTLTSDHSITGNGSASARLNDPLNQLSSIQIDGESIIELNFDLLSAHTYTLTGNFFTNELGRSSVSFNTDTLSSADTTSFSLSGTLLAGSHSLLINGISSLTAPGLSLSEYDFNLQFYDVSPVPVPAAIWLFGSGIIALSGLASVRRKRT